MKIEVRDVGPPEQEALLAVCRACPVEAAFRLLFDRGEAFFAWPDRVFERHRYVGAFAGGELVGYAMLGQATGWLGDGPERYGYLGDVRVLPAWRRHRVATLMVRALLEPPDPDLRAGYFLIAQGNEAAESSLRPSPEVRTAGTLAVYSLPLFGAARWRPPPGHVIRPAGPEDLENLAESFERAYRGRPFAPVLDAQGFAARLHRFGLRLEEVVVVLRGGAVVAFGAGWDAAPDHVTRVLGYTATGRLQKLGWDVSAALQGGASLPRPGGALRALTLMTWGADDPAGLRALLVSIGHAHAATGHHLLQVGFVNQDPLSAAVAGWRAHVLRSTLRVAEHPGFRIPEGRPWVEVAAI